MTRIGQKEFRKYITKDRKIMYDDNTLGVTGRQEMVENLERSFSEGNFLEVAWDCVTTKLYQTVKMSIMKPTNTNSNTKLII